MTDTVLSFFGVYKNQLFALSHKMQKIVEHLTINCRKGKINLLHKFITVSLKNKLDNSSPH